MDTSIDYLDLAISTCFTMRKVKDIVIQQSGKTFRLRPQNHLLIVSPFGTFKSSMTQILRKTASDDIFVNDDFTKPSIEGSISKDGDYVPSILINVGGKVFVIDEWNSVSPWGQSSMLSLLENQQSSRSLGFKVKSDYKYKDTHGFVEYKVNQNRISIKATFSCIAYAMEYPLYDNSQKAKALLSRFTPLFVQPTRDYIKAGTRGDFQLNIQDYSCIVDQVSIPKDVAVELNEKFYEYIDKRELWPADTSDYGFISRTLSEITRFGVYNCLKNDQPKKRVKFLEVSDSKYFTEYFDFIDAILLQFTNPETKNKLMQYKTLKAKNPHATHVQLARLMGVSTQTIYNYEQKLIPS